MKATLYDSSGKKKSEIDLPKVFEQNIREDMVAKLMEADKEGQPYSPSDRAGRRHSASGTISHKRHDWKGQYGRGISRTPRKKMWRRGTQFNWVGAEVSNVRGGRAIHGPKGIKRERKINRKETVAAFGSAFAATANENWILKRYASLADNGKLQMKVPAVMEIGNKLKSKDFFEALRTIFGNLFELVLKSKEIRSGRGKLRSRRYKSNAGLLVVIGDKEDVKIKGIDVKKLGELSISDLYPLGRITIYTENAIKEIGGRK